MIVVFLRRGQLSRDLLQNCTPRDKSQGYKFWSLASVTTYFGQKRVVDTRGLFVPDRFLALLTNVHFYLVFLSKYVTVMKCLPVYHRKTKQQKP